MFVAYLGIALAAKRVAPRPALGTLFLAAMLADRSASIVPLLYIPVPYTETLLEVVIWGLAFGCVYFAKRSDVRGAVCLGLVVVSHWVVDALFVSSDMLLTSRGPSVGLGDWLWPPAALALDAAMLAAGAWLYLSASRPRDWRGTGTFWSFIAAACVVFLIEAFLPAGLDVLQKSGLIGWMFVAWGYWIERHRQMIPPGVQPSH